MRNNLSAYYIRAYKVVYVLLKNVDIRNKLIE